jgi:cyclic pyranopterin phosphate synthase
MRGIIKEWTSPFNSFNSMKGLLYTDWYKAIREWQDGHRLAPLPPIEASIDPIHACNLMCRHCNAHRYLSDKSQYSRMEDAHLIDLVRFLGQWGVKACCFAGGGEPTMHTKLSDALIACKFSGMEASVLTNGTLLTDELMRIMIHYCRWIGVSIDAACPLTYRIGRNVDLFNKAISNLRELARSANDKCDVSFKFLIFDYNQHEILDACRLAKRLGVRDFHARPADYSHQGMGDLAKKARYNINLVREQFDKCHELEDDNFHVYTVVHKFDTNLEQRKGFSQCYASPLCIQLCADGGIYLCPDQRLQKNYRIGIHHPIEEICHAWGGKKHYDLVFRTGRDACTTRCTFGPYNNICEKLYIKGEDPFCKNFV